jgi:hypothetical protein
MGGFDELHALGVRPNIQELPDVELACLLAHHHHHALGQGYDARASRWRDEL